MPEKPCFMSDEEANSIDLVNPRTAQDEPQIASYMNYLVTNHGCIVPQYGDVNDALAVETLQKIYDETWGEGVFKCVGVDSPGCVRRRQHPLHHAAAALCLKLGNTFK